MTFLALVLLASLAGSVHCAAMCGGFVCVYSGGCGPENSRPAAHAAYNGARLVSYLVLGVAAGALGARTDDVGLLVGVGRAAAVIAGALMVVWGAGEIAGALGLRFARPGAASMGWAKRWIGRGLAASRNRPPVERAATIGVLTSLLPCGWLYAFVASAAATGSAAGGALVMLAFWAGTVPMLLGVALGAQRVFGTVRRRLPVMGAAMLVILGLLSIAGRVRPPVAMAGTNRAQVHAGH